MWIKNFAISACEKKIVRMQDRCKKTHYFKQLKNYI